MHFFWLTNFHKIQVEGLPLFESLMKYCTTLFQRYIVPKHCSNHQSPFSKGMYFQGFPFSRVKKAYGSFFQRYVGTNPFSKGSTFFLSLSQGYLTHKVFLRSLASSLLRFSFSRASLILSTTKLYYFDMVCDTSTTSFGFTSHDFVPKIYALFGFAAITF